MNKLSEFLKSEGLLCMLATFFVCSFLSVWIGLGCMIILLLCNLFYTKLLDTYKLAGFVAGWIFAVLQHLIY